MANGEYFIHPSKATPSTNGDLQPHWGRGIYNRGVVVEMAAAPLNPSTRSDFDCNGTQTRQ